MAKSRLSASRNQNKSVIQPKLDDNVTTLNLSFVLEPKGKVYSSKYNLLDWCYQRCDAQNLLASPSRLVRMQKLRAWVEQERKNQTSHATIENKLKDFKRYIIFCDAKNFDPFSLAGYLAYVGNAGRLRYLVDSAIERQPYQFQYIDNEELGLLESTAFTIKKHIDSLLSILEFDVSDFQATIQQFSNRKIESSTTPYTSTEWSSLVSKTQQLFFELANQLIAFKNNNPELPPPSVLKNIVIDKINGCNITLGSDKQGGAGSPFNQCMASAYTLFAYYTAFNDTVILNVRHPIKVVTSSKSEDRTSKFVQVRAYKGRSSKDVKALFAAEEESQHTEVSEDTAAGFIIADINKREKKGYANGIAFLNTLEQLSKAYSKDPYDTLIYFLDNNAKKSKIKINEALRLLSQNLNLLSFRRGELTDHLVKTFTDIVKTQKMTTYKWSQQEDGTTIMRKQVIDLDRRTATHRAIPIAFAALTCITDISLKNALLPLDYSAKDENGDITVCFKYMNDSEGKFSVAAKYLSFLKLLESYATSRNPLKNGRGSRSSTRYSFLLPIGKISETYQWKNGESLITETLLNMCGIGYGDYFLNITSGRIRVTNADLEYLPDDNGRSVQTVLQNNPTTAAKRYLNGHPVLNNKQVSQGMNALAHIASGKTRKQAVEQVKQELKIQVLEYETWKARNQPTNPNGILCNGQIDLASETDWHNAARKFAESHDIISKGQDITCFQYDLCVFCKSAKLVDDPYAIYKLLSFLEALGEVIDQYPERASVIQQKIERFQVHLEDLPFETIEQAENLLEEKGRYPLFDSVSSVSQYL